MVFTPYLEILGNCYAANKVLDVLDDPLGLLAPGLFVVQRSLSQLGVHAEKGNGQ